VRGADVVLVFGVAPIMQRIADKLAREAPPHACVVLSRRFELPLPSTATEAGAGAGAGAGTGKGATVGASGRRNVCQ
jgi:hypothetical protein